LAPGEKVPELTEAEKKREMILKGRYDFKYGVCLGKVSQEIADAMEKAAKWMNGF
jgi:hypothetical protein